MATGNIKNTSEDPLALSLRSRRAMHSGTNGGSSSNSSRSSNNNNSGGRYKWIVPGALTLILGASIVQLLYFHSNADFFLPPPTSTGLGPSILMDANSEWKVNVSSSSSSSMGLVGARPKQAAIAETDKTPKRGETESDISSTSSDKTRSLLTNNPSEEKTGNPLERLFADANVSATDLVSRETLSEVYHSMGQMYGDLTQPLILGLDTCATYQATVPLRHRYAAVAGLFNTGTNAMQFHLEHNLPTLRSKWQVPWGKHRVPQLTRLIHVAPGMNGVIQEHCLPVVMMRDPYNWMQSMCKSPYAADWHHNRKHCPNLVPNQQDLHKFGDKLKHSNNEFNVTVEFDKNQIVSWNSLIHLYNDWNQQYVKATYPRLLVRFEDMLLHAPAILAQVAHCAGVPPTTHFRYQIDSAKGHGSHTTFVKAVLKSGDVSARTRNMTTDDLQYAEQHLDPELMHVLHYTTVVSG